MKIKKPPHNITRNKNQDNQSYDDLIKLCIEKGLIEKTEFGYYQ